MIFDPFPELRGSAVVHVRTDVFSHSRAPFVRETMLGLTPYFRNIVLATGFDCELPQGTMAMRMDRQEMRTQGWAYSTAEALLESEPDIVAVIGHFGNGMRIGHPLAAALGVPILGVFGGSDVNVELNSERYSAAYRELFSDRDGYFLTVASYLAKKLIEDGAPPERTFSWRRGVDLSQFNPPAWSERLSAQGPIRVVMAGRFIEVKGFEYALRGFAEAVRDHPRLALDLYGDGPLEESLRGLSADLGISDMVRFRGHVKRSELIEDLRSAQIGMLASVRCEQGRTEGIPNVLVEGQAMALPIVATTNGGIPETVVDGGTGFLVPERDASAVADALRRLAADAARRARMGEAARAHVCANFDRDVQARRLAAKIGHMSACAVLRSTRPVPMPVLDIGTADVASSAENTKEVTPRHRNHCADFLERTSLDSFFSRPLLVPTSEPTDKLIDRVAATYTALLARLIFQPYFRRGAALFIERITRVTRMFAKQIARNTATLDAVIEQITKNTEMLSDDRRFVAQTARGGSALRVHHAKIESLQERPEAFGAVSPEVRQYMSAAQCEGCPHCSPSRTWPERECPMDIRCLTALEEECAGLGVPQAPQLESAEVLSGPALTLTDADLAGDGRLDYADGSITTVHCAADLQRVDDVPMLLAELRRILSPEGNLLLTVWPLFQGAAGGRLLGGLRAPFAHRLFETDVVNEYLGEPSATPKELEPRDLDDWIGAAGLAPSDVWIPNELSNPCSLEFQARFGAALWRLGRPANELRYGYVALLHPAD